MLGMITGMIRVEAIIEIAVYGIIGGAAGLLGKWIIQFIKHKIEKRFKR